MEKAERTFFDLLEINKLSYKVSTQKTNKGCLPRQEFKDGYVRLQNRRYLGNKYKLLPFIEEITHKKCGSINSFCDIFAGTGVVGERFNNSQIKIISNDFLSANYICLKTFLGVSQDIERNTIEKIKHLNNLEFEAENYFLEHFGGTYFSRENAKRVGGLREEIDNISENESEKNILICSLLYAMDKIANTVGHYDAFRKRLDMIRPIKLLMPIVNYSRNANNEIYKEDANLLIKKISCDVLYIDPPYNSRQYSDSYHLLENLVEWKKPKVFGIAKKMDRSHIKSDYCLNTAIKVFANLIRDADCKHILLSYNNTGDSKDGRSNARISDHEILEVLNRKGVVEVFQKDYKAFTVGNHNKDDNVERIFYCRVKK